MEQDDSRTCAAPDSEQLAEVAASWIVQLTADDPGLREHARDGFEAWKKADPRHARVAAEMEGLIGRLQQVREQAGNAAPVRAALRAAQKPGLSARSPGARSPLKRAATALGLACLLVVPAWLAMRAWPLPYLMADLHTATGQWREQRLPDGSRITLGSASAVNLHYDAAHRGVELVRGEILLDVAKDAARPFVVETRDGSIRALGTRFIVEREAEATGLTMLESRVLVRPAGLAGSPDAGLRVSAGQRVTIRADGLGSPETADVRSSEDAWRFHQLVANKRPLSEVLDALERHRPGQIHYDRDQLRGIEVFAVLPLDDTDRALELLRASLPGLRLRTLTPYFVMVDMPAAR